MKMKSDQVKKELSTIKRLLKIGNSKGIIIPSEFCELLGLSVSDFILIKVKNDITIELTKLW